MACDFTQLGLSDSLTRKLESLGITLPTPAQQAVIPLALEGKNVLFEAETGSGKTFAYALPLIERLKDAPGAPSLCIAAPTHELASQLKKMLESASGANIPLLIGGVPVKRQIEQLRAKGPIVTGTPARLVELTRLKKLSVAGISALVLDEADRLFSKELLESTAELCALVQKAAPGVQMIASSATIGEKAENQFRALAHEFETVRIKKYEALRNRIEHQALFAEDRDKIHTLVKYLKAAMRETDAARDGTFKALVFCARLDYVEKVYSALNAKNVPCGAIHAKAGKQARKGALDSFRNGKINVLVTSDVSARGLDIAGITHIVQTDMPEGGAFIHRVGRTARAGKTGINMVIGNAWEMRQYEKLEKQLGIAVMPKALYEGRLVPADGEQSLPANQE
ncbi:MAG: DEAD/DEAH box helicase [Treponemataceae bacterium]|nr:MAG: DEAD/DEAH box helicase [Treponemataceae bacterium]